MKKLSRGYVRSANFFSPNSHLVRYLQGIVRFVTHFDFSELLGLPIKKDEQLSDFGMHEQIDLVEL